MQQSDTAMLDKKELAAALQVSYGRIRVLVEEPSIAEFLGAADVPGLRGPRYPPDSVGKLKRIVAAIDQKVATVKTAAAVIQRQQRVEVGEKAGLAPGEKPDAPPAEPGDAGALVVHGARPLMLSPDTVKDGVGAVERIAFTLATQQREAIDALRRVVELQQFHNNTVEDKFLTASQVAADFIPGVSEEWLRKHVPSAKVGRARFWRRSEVLRFIADA